MYNKILMGSCAEKVASDIHISRKAQDDFAIESYRRARKAQNSGIFAWEICDVIQNQNENEDNDDFDVDDDEEEADDEEISITKDE